MRSGLSVMNKPQIKKWQAEALLELSKYREIDITINADKKIQIEVWKLRVYQHKINDLCRLLLKMDDKLNNAIDTMLGAL